MDGEKADLVNEELAAAEDARHHVVVPAHIYVNIYAYV